MDPLTAAAAAARQRAVHNIKTRVNGAVAGWLTDAQCVQASLAVGVRDAEELISLLFNRAATRAVLEHRDGIAIQENEWEALFGPFARATTDRALAAAETTPGHAELTRRVGVALRCTVAEPAERRVWGRALTQSAAVVALHRSGKNEAMLELCLGNLVKADSRRLEELRAELEDESLPLLLLSDTIVALSKAVL
tara:strand:- start:2180 stop:2764 length:585 start_codon:yes stop_codon:yes gene_type:complete